ncbi:hypothetical protein BGW80DRAFT_1419878, partial [Lactifluus volemus]
RDNKKRGPRFPPLFVVSSESRRGAGCAPPIPPAKNVSPFPHSQLHFFRGVDAAFLMFDVNQPATLHILT